jgi:glycosyltransferase involved in cell wall biosynthesis
VATRTGGLADAIEDGVDGMLVPPASPAELRTAIEKLLADPALRAELGIRARARAEASYSWAVAAGALSSAYADALRRTT